MRLTRGFLDSSEEFSSKIPLFPRWGIKAKIVEDQTHSIAAGL